MIPFIIFATLLVLCLLIFSFIIEEWVIGIVASMAIIIIGVAVLSSGVEGIINTFTMQFGIIMVGFGAFIFINGSLQQIQQF